MLEVGKSFFSAQEGAEVVFLRIRSVLVISADSLQLFVAVGSEDSIISAIWFVHFALR